MEEVQLKVKVPRELKDAVAEKAKAEDKTMKQVVEEMLILYTTGELPAVGQDIVQIQQPISKEQDQFPEGTLKPEDFKNRLDYVDYLERMGLIYEDE